MLLAVHIADGVLTGPWLIGGFVGAALLLLVGAWRLPDEVIPRTALLTAAFFVASLIHVNVGPTSVHLLLNGLVGVLLGRYAALAIPLAVFLQAVLLQHGGISAVGVNACVMTLPALLAWQMFRLLRTISATPRGGWRSALVGIGIFSWFLVLVYCGVLLVDNYSRSVSELDLRGANHWTFHPLTLTAALFLSGAGVWAERRLENGPEFPIGLLVGEAAVLATTLLNSVVLVWGGREDWPSLILIVLLPHVVITLIEGMIVGFILAFLARVKPEMLGERTPENWECLAEPVP